MVLAPCDSPGTWSLPGALWQLLRVPGVLKPGDSVTNPRIAQHLQSPVALFFMAAERRLCRLVVDKTFDLGKRKTVWRGLDLEVHLQGLSRQKV